MRSYTETYTFSLFEKDYKIQDRLKELPEHMIKIPDAILSDYIIQIDRGANIPIKKKVIEAFKTGKIQIYLTDSFDH